MFTSSGAPSANTARANCISSEKRTSTTMSASTTMASTKSLSRPREPVSVMTAALMVGEKLTTTTTSRLMIASFVAPWAAGAIFSHGQSTHATAARPVMATASVTIVATPAPATRRSSRSKLSVRPAMNAISVVATPLTAINWRAICSVMTLARYGPINRPKSRYPVSLGRRNRLRNSPVTSAATSANPIASAVARVSPMPAGPTSRMMTIAATTRTIPARRLICRKEPTPHEPARWILQALTTGRTPPPCSTRSSR